MATEEQSSAIKGAKVLMVGAGGIGCELLKTLVLSGFSDIHIIDMDTIEVSNLNRQFLFRKSHVGKSKAQVACDSVLKFRPCTSIIPHHANVKDPSFNVDFFKQFNVVLNGLDNLDARRHVNRLCLASGVPMIDSGTAGFLGQVTVHAKGVTECYECQPKPVPKTYAVCTITSTPKKFAHCIVWAKDLLFEKLFGDRNKENHLNVSNSSSPTQDAFERRSEEGIEEYALRIFDHVFVYNLELSLSIEDTWKNHNKPKPIYLKDVLNYKVIFRKGNHLVDCCHISAMDSLRLKNPQDVWSLKENAMVFLEALHLLFSTRQKEIGRLTFDKDDQLAMEFVAAAANIRACSFDIPLHSLFEAKGIAGNIVHAVVTTNAIISGSVVIEAIRVLQNDVNNYRMTFCRKHASNKMLLAPVKPCQPNKACYVCSEMPLTLEVNPRRSKLRDLVNKIVRKQLGMNLPLMMHGSVLLYEDGDGLEDVEVANYEANLDKVLSELPSPLHGGTILTIEDLQQELRCSVNIKHREEFDPEKEPDEMIISGWTAPVPVNPLGPSSVSSESLTFATEEDDDGLELEIIQLQTGIKGKGFFIE